MKNKLFLHKLDSGRTRVSFLFSFTFLVSFPHLFAQQNMVNFVMADAKKISSSTFKFSPDHQVVTYHSDKINGKKVRYKAVTGTLPLYDNFRDRKFSTDILAGLFFTYYLRTNKPKKERPIAFCFNGGPGSSSVWLHMGYLGPKLANLDSLGNAIEPYGFSENLFSILDEVDLVFVNTVNTAFSRKINDQVPDSFFFRYQEEIDYLASWIVTFLNRFQRWTSPLFLIGESYGTVRVAQLANQLQDSYFVFSRGVVLISPTNLGLTSNKYIDNAFLLPDLVKQNWLKKVLPDSLQRKSWPALAQEVDTFLFTKLIPSICLGSDLRATEKNDVTRKLALYTAIPERKLFESNFQIPQKSGSFFPSTNNERLKERSLLNSNHTISNAFQLPFMAATAWYHNRLGSHLQSMTLENLLLEVEDFSVRVVVPFLYKRDTLNNMNKRLVAERISEYCGLSPQLFLDENFDIAAWKYVDLLFADSVTFLNIYDSRNKTKSPSSPLNHAFAPAINSYLSRELKYTSELNYIISAYWFGDQDNSGNHLRSAMQKDSSLKLLIQSGYYDGATDYFSALFTKRHIDPSGGLNQQLNFKAYPGGHMMYLVRDVLQAASTDLRNFILKALGQ